MERRLRRWVRVRTWQCCRIVVATGLTLLCIRVGLSLRPPVLISISSTTAATPFGKPPTSSPLRMARQEALDRALFEAVEQEQEYAQLHGVQTGDVERITSLLDQGANPNARDEEGLTPLFHAHEEVMDLLIARGADIEAREPKHGDTPLMDYAGNTECTLTLLRHGAD